MCTKPKQLDTPNDSTTSVATQASELDIVDSNHSSNDKNRKKKDRHLAQALKSVLNSMSALNTPEEKLAALCIKYADLMEENTKLKVNQVKIRYILFSYFYILFVFFFMKYRLLINKLKKEYLRHSLNVM